MKIVFCVLVLSVLQRVCAYLDIQLQIRRQNNYISYAVPTKINDVDYLLSISFCDCNQFIRPLSDKISSKKKKKHKVDKSQQLTAVIKATSLEGYSFEGWKRFFMEALLFLQSRYYHQVKFSLSQIQKKSLGQTESYHDGIIKFGPNLENNKFLQLMRQNSEFAKRNVVSIYRGLNDKNVRMQLGGFQQSFAKGLKNGILFYELPLFTNNGKWQIPVRAISCLRDRNNKEDIFYVANSNLNLAINIQSSLLKLPKRFASDIERNFENSMISCKITESSRLSCDNMSAVDLALNFIQFKIDDGAFINISLYDLRDNYDQKSKETVFSIQFVESDSEAQLGESLFKGYYVSIDMENKKMLYSPINRFPSESYGKYVIRFLIAFGIFTIVVAIGAMIWQMFNDPFRKNKLMYGQDGVRLVSYQRPNQIEE